MEKRFFGYMAQALAQVFGVAHKMPAGFLQINVGPMRNLRDEEKAIRLAQEKRTRKNKKRLNDFADCHYSNPAKPAGGLINRTWIANA